jgi:hypothetical protein
MLSSAFKAPTASIKEDMQSTGFDPGVFGRFDLAASRAATPAMFVSLLVTSKTKDTCEINEGGSPSTADKGLGHD